MRKIFGLTIAALLVIGLAGAGTWAYFSDVEASTGNVLTAGTLDLTTGGVTTLPFSVSDVAPGDAVDPEVNVTLTNAGSLSGDLSVTTANLVNNENGVEDPEGDASLGNDTTSGATQGELGSKVEIAIWFDEGNDGFDDANDFYLVDGGTTQAWTTGTGLPSAAYDYIDNLGADTWSDITTLAGSDVIYFKISYQWTDSSDVTDNIAQGDDCTFDITFNLLQS